MKQQEIASNTVGTKKEVGNVSIKDSALLITPEMKVAATKREPALNSRAREIKRDFFRK